MKEVPDIRFKGFSDSWNEFNLNNYVEFSKGSTLLKKDLTQNGYPVILYGRLYTNYKTIIEDIDTFTLNIKNTKFSAGGEVIIPASGETSEEISRASVIKNQGVIIGSDLNILKCKKNIDPVFLALQLTYGKPHIEISKKAQGKSIVHIHNSDLEDLSILSPNIKEQQKIGNFINQIDNLISSLSKKIDLLKKYKGLMLSKMFPKDGCDVPEVRFKGFNEKWKNDKFSNFIERRSEIDNDKFLPHIEYEDIISGEGCLNKDIFLKHSEKSGIKFNKNDILFGKLRPYLKNYLIANFSGIAVGDFWVLFSKNCSTKFIYYLIQTSTFQNVSNQSVGTKMPRSDWKLVSNYRICR